MRRAHAGPVLVATLALCSMAAGSALEPRLRRADDNAPEEPDLEELMAMVNVACDSWCNEFTCRQSQCHQCGPDKGCLGRPHTPQRMKCSKDCNPFMCHQEECRECEKLNKITNGELGVEGCYHPAPPPAVPPMPFYPGMTAQCGSDYGSCVDAHCCFNSKMGCFKRNGRSYAMCKPYNPAKCEDDKNWLCPGWDKKPPPNPPHSPQPSPPPRPVPKPPPPPPRPPPPPPPEVELAEFSYGEIAYAPDDPAVESNSGGTVVLILAVLVVIAAGALVMQHRRKQAKENGHLSPASQIKISMVDSEVGGDEYDDDDMSVSNRKDTNRDAPSPMPSALSNEPATPEKPEKPEKPVRGKAGKGKNAETRLVKRGEPQSHDTRLVVREDGEGGDAGAPPSPLKLKGPDNANSVLLLTAEDAPTTTSQMIQRENVAASASSLHKAVLLVAPKPSGYGMD